MPFDLHTLFELWLAKNQTLHLETAYFGQRSSSTDTEMSDFQTQTVDLKYPLEFGLSTSALSIGSTFAYTTPFHGNLRLQIIIITIFRKKTIIILLLLLKIRDKNK